MLNFPDLSCVDAVLMLSSGLGTKAVFVRSGNVKFCHVLSPQIQEKLSRRPSKLSASADVLFKIPSGFLLKNAETPF